MNFKKDVHDTLLYLQQKNVDIKELVRFLQKTPEIKELHLHGCNISDKDVKVLADANLSLSCLNLRDNKI
ncbi:hypothetical protein INQ25_05535, partial [Wolbachia endosymbiont of Rhagoletis cerasi]|uniref:hypothetical protein n=1 Tax=Wolbachia endosymbiont of Rhagoletis cerasi TaxID=225363 RepID=UPI001BD27625